MKIRILQHVPYETPGYVANICSKYHHKYQITKLYDGILYVPDDFDVLIIMGGPMNVYEELEYPWLIKEKNLIRTAIEDDKIVFGFCLGAQLIADALGAKVFPMKTREIGWYPVKKKTGPGILDFLHDMITVFHWHGDTFELPKGATRLYESEVTKNQAFIYGDKVLGLQFHPEMVPGVIEGLIQNNSEELDGSQYVMDEDELVQNYSRYSYSNHCMMENIFRYFLKKQYH